MRNVEININSLRVKCQDHLRITYGGSIGSISTGVGEENASATSMVLATNKSKEMGLELHGRESIGVPPVPPLEVLAATGTRVAAWLLSEG
ncbi:hypothetical protein CsSME_00053082 [Camellia sinensis var. sinensis]